MEQEKELLENRIERLTAELKSKTEELLSTNREKGKEVLELQSIQRSSAEQVTHEPDCVMNIKLSSILDNTFWL